MTRRASAAAALLLALSACAGVPRAPGTGFAFPASFAASQVVTVRAERGAQELLASVWREPGRIEVAFLDPALQAPLVVARLSGGSFVEERLVEFPMAHAEVEGLLRDVDALYASDGYRPEGNGWRDRIGRWTVELSPTGGSGACRFPDRIVMYPAGAELPRIEVRTLDVRCGSR